MIKMAIMGYGVVGGGVYDIVRKNAETISQNLGDELDIKYILDIRDFPDHPEKNLFVKDADIIANDDEVKIVAETMGGTTFAYDFTKKMLSRGKSVVTSNKELVSSKGVELFKIAEENGARYLFEASVGGGIPIIRPLVNCLAANRITSVSGILNGTTNYILTKMFKANMPFDEALKNAQIHGYAEKDPSADILGYDTARKTAILMSLAFKSRVDDKKIPTEGIEKITADDVKSAAKAGYSIKLIGRGYIEDDKVFARVAPMLVGSESPISAVEGVFNAVNVTGDMVGDVMMYGRGAGKKATASAVVADVLDAARCKGKFESRFSWGEERENSFIDPLETKSAFFVRCEKTDDEIGRVFGEVEKIEDGVFITNVMTESEFFEKEKLLGGILSKIRVYSNK